MLGKSLLSAAAPATTIQTSSTCEDRQEIVPAKVFSIKAVCDYTDLGRTLISSVIKSGDLPARKAGRRTLILKADLDRWLDSLPQCAGNLVNGPRRLSPAGAAAAEVDNA